jgi:hypothetical protein
MDKRIRNNLGLFFGEVNLHIQPRIMCFSDLILSASSNFLIDSALYL